MIKYSQLPISNGPIGCIWVNTANIVTSKFHVSVLLVTNFLYKFILLYAHMFLMAHKPYNKGKMGVTRILGNTDETGKIYSIIKYR